MAVPDTNTFTLQDVVDEISPTNDDLVGCFADADSAKFDAIYEGSKDRLSNFRNYGALCTSVTSFSLTGANTSSSNACSSTANITRYHDGAGALPVNGDVVYTDSSGCTVLTGFSNWYSDGTNAYQINNSGVVSNSTFC